LFKIDVEKYQEFLSKRREKNPRVLKYPKFRYILRRFGEELLNLLIALGKVFVVVLVFAVVGLLIYFLYPAFNGEWVQDFLNSIIDYENWGSLIRETNGRFFGSLFLFFAIGGFIFWIFFILIPKVIDKAFDWLFDKIIEDDEEDEENEEKEEEDEEVEKEEISNKYE
jgi:hypothetical protein